MKQAMENKSKSLGQEIICREKSKCFFELPLFSSNSSEGLVRKSKITGTPEENEDIYSVVHRSVSDPFVPIHRRIRKESFEPMINASSFSFDHNKEAM